VQRKKPKSRLKRAMLSKCAGCGEGCTTYRLMQVASNGLQTGTTHQHLHIIQTQFSSPSLPSCREDTSKPGESTTVVLRLYRPCRMHESFTRALQTERCLYFRSPLLGPTTTSMRVQWEVRGSGNESSSFLSSSACQLTPTNPNSS
jgi:hypothetical protein